MNAGAADWEQRIAAIYRADRARVLGSLVRLLGDFDLAEEAVHDAFSAALEQWPARGMPDSPWRWLVSAGRFKTIDRLRRRGRLKAATPELTRQIEEAAEEQQMPAHELLEDDTLRLVFTCCHPALPPDAQVALTLREVCGLGTEEIARAFLTGAPTVAQRIVRAKARIRDGRLPYEVPSREDLPERLETVLRVVYLIFNEGYSTHAGEPTDRARLAGEAIRLERLLVDLLPDPEALGLLALMLLNEARRPARLREGEIVLLPDQDRALWDNSLIREGLTLLDTAWRGGEVGSYALQAAIAAEHVRAPAANATDWGRIVEIYDLLRVADPSPVVELNRAVAVGMRDGPAAGIAMMDALFGQPALSGYHAAFTARAELLRRLGRFVDARLDYERALGLATQAVERRWIERQLASLPPVAAQGAASSAAISSTSDS